MDEKPAEAVRAQARLVARRRARRASREGEADAVVSAGNTGAMLAAGLLHLRRLPGVMRPAIAVPIPTKSGPVGPARLRARTRTHARSTCSSSRTWARSSRRRSSRSRGPRCGCSRSARSRRRATSSTLEAHALLAASELEFAGNAESRDAARGGRRRRRLRRLHRQRGAEDCSRGRSRPCSTPCATEIAATPRGKLGGLLIRPGGAAAALEARSRDVRRRVPARPARARPSSRTATRRAARSRTRFGWRRRGVEHDVVGRLAARMPERRTPAAV